MTHGNSYAARRCARQAELYNSMMLAGCPGGVPGADGTKADPDSSVAHSLLLGCYAGLGYGRI
jgi:hypothetical protein